MVKTTQINFRMPQTLVDDLDFISKNLSVHRTEWLKVKLAELILSEKTHTLQMIEDRYVNGFVTDAEFKNSTGICPSDSMKKRRTKSPNIKIQVENAYKRYLNEILFKAYPDAKGHHDEYLKEILDKINKSK